jgi:hypothetical protein
MSIEPRIIKKIDPLVLDFAYMSIEPLQAPAKVPARDICFVQQPKDANAMQGDQQNDRMNVTQHGPK